MKACKTELILPIKTKYILTTHYYDLKTRYSKDSPNLKYSKIVGSSWTANGCDVLNVDMFLVKRQVLPAEDAVALSLPAALDAPVFLHAGEEQLRLHPALRLAAPPFAEGYVGHPVLAHLWLP